MAVSGHDIFELLFQPILLSLHDSYLLLHRHLLDNFTMLTISRFMTLFPLHELERINHWGANY